MPHLGLHLIMYNYVIETRNSSNSRSFSPRAAVIMITLCLANSPRKYLQDKEPWQHFPETEGSTGHSTEWMFLSCFFFFTVPFHGDARLAVKNTLNINQLDSLLVAWLTCEATIKRPTNFWAKDQTCLCKWPNLLQMCLSLGSDSWDLLTKSFTPRIENPVNC